MARNNRWSFKESLDSYMMFVAEDIIPLETDNESGWIFTETSVNYLKVIERSFK